MVERLATIQYAKNKPSAMYRSGAKNYVSLDGDIKV